LRLREATNKYRGVRKNPHEKTYKPQKPAPNKYSYIKMAVPFLKLTKLQKQILFEFVRQQGYTEGVHKLYQRLKRDIGSIEHPAMNSNGDIALNNENEVLEFEDNLPNVAGNKYLYKGTEYEYETRAVTKKGVMTIERRKLLPSRRGIEDYFRKDEMVQIDKQSREANAGGQRTAPKHGIRPILPPPHPLSIVQIDAMRMPICIHNQKQYSWLLLIVDALTKMVYIKPLHLSTQLSTTQKSRDVADDEDDSRRPASGQVTRAYVDFIRRINKTRKHYAEKTNTQYSGDIHPMLTVSDRGSENSGLAAFLNKLKEKHPNYYNFTQTPYGRSRFNSIAEGHVRIVRRLMYGIQRAFQEQVINAKKEGEKVGKIYRPRDWHTANNTSAAYDWVKDCDLCMQRHNSSIKTTIKSSPIAALLEIEITHKIVAQRIKTAAEKRWKDVKFNLRLPGYSPSSPVAMGDYVRLKIYKSGDMSLRFPSLEETRKGRKITGKSASNNFTTRIYKVIGVRTLNKGQKLYKVADIDTTSNTKQIAWLDRTQVQKIHPETILSTGRSIQEEEEFLNTEASDSDIEADVLPKPKQRQKKQKPISQWQSEEWSNLLKDKEFNDEGQDWVIVDALWDRTDKIYGAIYIPVGTRNTQQNRQYTPILELLEDSSVKWKIPWDFEKYVEALSK
jgi:hypothetical protein